MNPAILAMKTIKDNLGADQIFVDITDEHTVIRVRWDDFNYQRAYSNEQVKHANLEILQEFYSSAGKAYHAMVESKLEIGEPENGNVTDA